MTNPLKEGALTENSAGIGTVTREMVRERAVELALINGRTALEVSKSDWEQAKQELAEQPNIDSETADLESASQSEVWIRCLVQPDAAAPTIAGQEISTL